MTPPRRRVGFILLSNSRDPAPSTRIAVLNVLPILETLGYSAEILFEPASSDETPDLDRHVGRLIEARCDLVVIQKAYGASVIRAVRALRTAGIPTVYSVCDLVIPEMVEETHASVVVTEHLRQLYPPALHQKITVVHDGIERPEVVREDSPGSREASGRLRAVLVTSQSLRRIPILEIPPSGYEVEIVGRYVTAQGPVVAVKEVWSALRRARSVRDRWYTCLASIHPFIRRIPWTQETAYAAMRRADVAIIPADYSLGVKPGQAVPGWTVKSENRLTMKMAIGLPVVASPIPSYEGVLAHGVTGFFARSRRDWLDSLERLKDPALRVEMGRAARAAVLERFSKERQAALLAEVFDAVLQANPCAVNVPPT